MAVDKKNKLGEYLIAQGVISEGQLLEALDLQKTQKKFLGEILVEKRFVSEKDIVKILSEQLNLPVIADEDLTLDENLKDIFPPKKLREWKAVPIQFKENTLMVAVANPLDMRIIQDIKHLTAYKIKLTIATPSGIIGCLDKWFGSSDRLQAAIDDIEIEKGEKKEEAVSNIRKLEEAVEDAPVVQLVNSMIREAIHQRASDIHLEPQKEGVRVRFRVDGVLHKKFEVPKELQLSVTSRIKIISGLDISEMRKPQDGKMKINLAKKEYDIRVSSLPDSYGEKIVMRILDKQSVLVDLNLLGLDDAEQEFFRKVVETPYGILLVTGPTGSGKTTTLYSVLNKLNDETRNIVTVEDPIEYELNGINQTEVNVRAGYTFATGMRHILRQDPNVIMIGEVRDLETAEIAVQAALTGHLVFSTLHTNNAPGAIVRLVDMHVEPFLIGASVIAIIAQRLVRKLCPDCAKKEDVSRELERYIQPYLAKIGSYQFKKAQGCPNCDYLGYKGRTVIFEMMRMTPEIKDLVLRRAPEADIRAMAITQGMSTLQMSALRKVCQGVTSLEEAMRVTLLGKE